VVCKVQRLFVTRPIPGFDRISVERQAHQLIGMLLMLGDLDLIVETDPENAFTRRMRKGLGGGCNKVLAGSVPCWSRLRAQQSAAARLLFAWPTRRIELAG
jgi:hypothetical protein